MTCTSNNVLYRTKTLKDINFINIVVYLLYIYMYMFHTVTSFIITHVIDAKHCCPNHFRAKQKRSELSQGITCLVVKHPVTG